VLTDGDKTAGAGDKAAAVIAKEFMIEGSVVIFKIRRGVRCPKAISYSNWKSMIESMGDTVTVDMGKALRDLRAVTGMEPELESGLGIGFNDDWATVWVSASADNASEVVQFLEGRGFKEV
jgi:hypothetical protein